MNTDEWPGAWPPRTDHQTDAGPWISRTYGDRLSATRPCPYCHRPVRYADPAWERLRISFALDGPIPADTPISRGELAYWWHAVYGLIDYMSTGAARWAAADAHLYRDHLCNSLKHRPDQRNQMSSSPFETFVPPVLEEGDSYSPKDHVGHVVIVKARERKDGVVTPNSPDGGAAVIVDLVDLGDGQKYTNVLWMGGAFVDALTGYVGKGPVVLEIESRVGKSGRAYAAPKAATDEQIALATSFYSAKGDPFAQTFVTVEDPATRPAWA